MTESEPLDLEKLKKKVKEVFEEVRKRKERAGELSLVSLTEEEKRYAYGRATAYAEVERLIKKYFPNMVNESESE